MAAEGVFAGAEKVVAHLGRWPSFHDAEVRALRLDAGREGEASLEVDVHVLDVATESEGDAVSRPGDTIVTLRFEDVCELELAGFGPQNVLWDLEVDEDEDSGGALLLVALPSSNGLEGQFTCRRASVLVLP